LPGGRAVQTLLRSQGMPPIMVMLKKSIHPDGHGLVLSQAGLFDERQARGCAWTPLVGRAHHADRGRIECLPNQTFSPDSALEGHIVPEVVGQRETWQSNLNQKTSRIEA
jgi:hypothetical protein